MNKPNKYRAMPTCVDSIRFASKREARHYSELKLRQRAGEIRLLELQPIYPIIINGKHIGRYTADFRYFEGDKQKVIDVKGFDTRESKLRRKIVEALYSCEIEIVR